MKKKALLIAEKPDLMRAVRTVYEKFGHADDIDFETFVGHTMRLKNPDEYDKTWKKWSKDTLPIIPSEFGYLPSDDKVDIYHKIKTKIEIGNYDYLINCCDPDREGEAIFATFYNAIGCTLPVKRMWHLDLTDKELKKNLDNPRDSQLDKALVNLKEASLLRSKFDWLVGMNYSRAVTLMGNKTIAVGRVMTPTLKIIVDRENEIANFKPSDFWEIEADFKDYKGIYFDHNNENESRFLDKSKADDLISKLKNDGIVETVDTRKTTSYAPRLHSLADLQNEANRTYGFTLDLTLSIIQTLYEKKILSYPRTDCSFISVEVAKGLRSNVKAIAQIPGLEKYASAITDNDFQSILKNKRYVDDSKVTAHYAIIPTGAPFKYETLPKNEQLIMELVAKRLIAIFMKPVISNKTEVVTAIDNHKFKTSGSILLDKGYSVLYNRSFNDNILPDLKKGNKYPLVSTRLITKTTTPPKRYTDATLNSSMENAGKFIEDDEAELREILKTVEGIGTPATRSQIISKLIALKMIERQGRGKTKSFAATDVGMEIISALKDFQIVSPELTGVWEGKLKKVESDELNPKQFEAEMVEYIKEQIAEILSNVSLSFSSIDSSKIIGKCPVCKEDVWEGKNFYLCKKYGKEDKDCKFIIGKKILGATVSATEAKKILDLKPSRELSFKNKEGKNFKATLVFNAEKSSVGFKFKDLEKVTATPIGVCPLCGNDVMDRGSFCSCSNYKDCKFSLGYTISSAKLSKSDIQKLIKGEEIGPKTFTWKNKKKGEASLKYDKVNKKLEFIFPKRG